MCQCLEFSLAVKANAKLPLLYLLLHTACQLVDEKIYTFS